MLDCILELFEPCQSTTSIKRSATPSAGKKKKPCLGSGSSQKTSYDMQQAQKWTDEWKPRMLSNDGGKGRCVECAGKYPELECCKVKNGHFWHVYEFDGWQKSKNPSMAVASDARSYCPDCYKKEVGRAMRVAKGKHRKAASGLKPQSRHRVRNIRDLAAEAGLMVEGGSEDEFGGHDGEGGEGDQHGDGGDSMADKGSDPGGVIDGVTPLHVTAIPVCSPASDPVTTEDSHPAGSDWQTDTIATDLETFFESLPNDHERTMMDSDAGDFLNFLS